MGSQVAVSGAVRREAARVFAATWAGRGYEKGDTASYWNQLLTDVVGMRDVVTNVRYEERTSQRGFVDVTIADAKTIIEQKALGVDLDKPELRQGREVTPFEQARAYANAMTYSLRPRFIIVCNFQEFRIHDLDRLNPETDFVSFRLSELPEQYHLLDFLVDPQRARRQREQRASMDAGVLIGTLYQALRAQYIDPDAEDSQHSLNVLCVRLVFCLFAEDAGLFGKDAFFHYLKNLQPEQVRTGLLELFRVLDTPPTERDPYLSDALKAFPYVNGGLFRDSNGPIEIPQFTPDIHTLLVEEVSRDTNWAQISPTIFGGVFESTLNPETRAKGGMHYTSPENIHKVIDPLFLDALHTELEAILNDAALSPVKKNNRLKKLHDKIAGLTFFDPACGSGNFLTETYISLRRIENKILSELHNNQTAMAFEDVTPLKVSLRQFYGLEINDFAVSVAATALWIAQLQANIEAQSIITQDINDLPLSDAAHIHHANALTTDWSEVLSPAECNYIIGNPPFLGARNQSKEQKAELTAVFPPGTKNVGNIDYVAGWFIKAAQFAADFPVRIAFVSTNSVVQGEQVANIWYPITKLGFRINFAHDTFRWANEASDQAHVFCVIVGFSQQDDAVRLYHYDHPDAEPVMRQPSRLNPYLADAPDVFVWNRSTPLGDVPTIGIGNKPIDGGNYLFTPEEKEEFLKQEPAAAPYFHRWVGSKEFIQGHKRWVLWLGEVSPSAFKDLPLCRERVRRVRDFRLASKSAPTQKLAETPQRFHVENMPEEYSIIVPRVSSERRKTVPMGFVGPEVFASDSALLIPNANLFHFGVLSSQIHNTWVRTVAGRLKSDFRYSGGVVYNNFVFPEPTDAQRAAIESAAQAVLDARASYQGATLADLYDPDNDWLYPDLTKAHKALDAAVEAAYGVDYHGLDDAEKELAIVSHLFELYAQKTASQ